MNVEVLLETSDKEFVWKANTFMVDSYSEKKKLAGKDFDNPTKIIEAYNQQATSEDQQKNL